MGSTSIVPPHEYFSGVGITYLLTLSEFLLAGDFFIEVSEPGTEFRLLGELPYRP